MRKQKASPISGKNTPFANENAKILLRQTIEKSERGTFNIQQALITSVPNSFPFPKTGLSQPSIQKCPYHLMRSCARLFVTATAAAVVQCFVSPFGLRVSGLVWGSLSFHNRA